MRSKELGYSAKEIGGHSTGLKVDVIGDGLSDPAVRDEFIRRCEEIGIQVINEYEKKFEHTTGDHLDLNMADYDEPEYEYRRPETTYTQPRESVPPPTPRPAEVVPRPQTPTQPIPSVPQEPVEEDGILVQGIKKVGQEVIDIMGTMGDELGGLGRGVIEAFGGGEDVVKPTAFAQSAFEQVDPRLLQDIRSGGNGAAPAYAPSGSQSIVVQNTVHVGDIHVANSNASPRDIGNAVADETMRRLQKKANYKQIDSAVIGYNTA